MDWLAFIASIIGSLAWPTAVVSIALIFRRAILKLLPDVSELEYGKFKVKFQKELAEVKEQAELAALPSAPARTVLPEASKGSSGERNAAADFVHLALASPRAAVIESWMQVEQELGRLTQRAGITTRAGTVGKLSTLEERGLLTAELSRVIENLRSLRNEAAHYPQFAPGVAEAIEYAQLADRVTAALRAAQAP